MAWQSVLEGRHARYVRAIGMVSIENGNMEVLWSRLLAVMLNVPDDIAEAIYFAPKARGREWTSWQTLRKQRVSRGLATASSRFK
jgi:hypothetical protein